MLKFTELLLTLQFEIQLGTDENNQRRETTVATAAADGQ